eukprot:jgi/Botrbrau1/21932/Bobra.0249s0055.1
MLWHGGSGLEVLAGRFSVALYLAIRYTWPAEKGLRDDAGSAISSQHQTAAKSSYVLRNFGTHVLFQRRRGLSVTLEGYSLENSNLEGLSGRSALCVRRRRSRMFSTAGSWQQDILND